MAGEIFIEADEVDFVGLPLGAMHLYLVFRDTNGDEYVIRSGPENRWLPWFGDMKVETNIAMADSADDRGSVTPAERFSTSLDFDGRSDDEAWAIMVKYATMIDSANTPYEVFDENSNAFIGAMLAAAGGDPLAMLPNGVSRGDALGLVNYGDILSEVAPPADGIIRGTSGDDRIAGIQIDDVIKAGRGDDTVWGGRGSDVIFGGAGQDRLDGQDGGDVIWGARGNDRLFGRSGGDEVHGQAGADRAHGGNDADQLFGGRGDDRLFGGAGADVLDGGPGHNVLKGGADADVFQFTQASSNEVRDFEDGVDRLRIQDDLPILFADLAVTGFGAPNEHTRIVHEDLIIELLGVGPDHVDQSDFELIVA